MDWWGQLLQSLWRLVDRTSQMSGVVCGPLALQHRSGPELAQSQTRLMMTFGVDGLQNWPVVGLWNVPRYEVSKQLLHYSCPIPKRAGRGDNGQRKERRTMVQVLLLWQVGFLKMIIRQTHGRLHQRLPGMMVLVGSIR